MTKIEYKIKFKDTLDALKEYYREDLDILVNRANLVTRLERKTVGIFNFLDFIKDILINWDILALIIKFNSVEYKLISEIDDIFQQSDLSIDEFIEAIND